MKCLTIQIERQRLADSDFANFDQPEFLKRVHAVGRYPEIDLPEIFEGDYHNDCISFNFFTEQLPQLWADLQRALYRSDDYAAVIAPVSIAACEGDQGWDDYQLLHHFDASETTVEL